MSCLSEETVQSLVQGELSRDTEALVHEHCAACSPCRRLVAEVARCLFEDTDVVLSQRNEQKTIGRYIILEAIGEGGSAIVYAAFDPDLGRKVALKLLRSGPSATGDAARRRMLREAQTMARLSHPNVVTVYDVGTWQGQVFVAMELVVGRTLKTWQSETTRTRRQVLEVFLAAGRGLAAAHAAGVVHRDFKPDNVLVGADGRVHVTDFGLARPASTDPGPPGDAPTSGIDATILRARTAIATLTQTGAMVGTPAYMAPEQFAGRATDARTDQFSFCVALYEALYGHRPFAGKTLEELVLSVMRGQATLPPGEADRDKLAQAIVRGLDVAPERRHASVDVLLELMERELNPPPSAHSLPPRNRARFAMAIALIGLTGAAAITMFRKQQPLESAPLRPGPTTMNEPGVGASSTADEPVTDLPQAPSPGALEPADSAPPQKGAHAARGPSRSVDGRHPNASAKAPPAPSATSSAARRGPGVGAREDGALIPDPWSRP